MSVASSSSASSARRTWGGRNEAGGGVLGVGRSTVNDRFEETAGRMGSQRALILYLARVVFGGACLVSARVSGGPLASFARGGYAVCSRCDCCGACVPVLAPVLVLVLTLMLVLVPVLVPWARAGC